MWCRSYRKHVIMAFPSFDTATRSWAPQANITWLIGAARESAFVRFPMRVTSEDEAVEIALAAGKIWIDERKCSAPLDTLLKGNARQMRRIGPVSLKSSEKTLTFDDFKANLSGAENLPKRSLLKSYAALLELRKTSHCSWAQIKSMLKRSQEGAVAHVPTHRRTKPAALPLTPQGWRRIM